MLRLTTAGHAALAGASHAHSVALLGALEPLGPDRLVGAREHLQTLVELLRASMTADGQ